jgi:hypothetical protein
MAQHMPSSTHPSNGPSLSPARADGTAVLNCEAQAQPPPRPAPPKMLPERTQLTVRLPSLPVACGRYVDQFKFQRPRATLPPAAHIPAG